MKPQWYQLGMDSKNFSLIGETKMENKIASFVMAALEEMPKFQIMDADHQGFIVMLICADMEVNGWLDSWSYRKIGINTAEVKRLWRKYRNR